jgi:hypothetical protein
LKLLKKKLTFFFNKHKGFVKYAAALKFVKYAATLKFVKYAAALEFVKYAAALKLICITLLMMDQLHKLL